MTVISLAGVASYLPEKVVDNDFFTGGKESKHPMFKGAKTRHHVEDETAVDMIERATERLAKKLNLNLHEDVDLILTNVSCLDMPFTGCGASVAHRIGANPKFILDVQNSGCVSFVYMMEMAHSLMQTTGARSALICNVQNAAGRVFSHPDIRSKPQSAIPGDACGVGLLVVGGNSPIKSIKTANFGEYADDMQVVNEDGEKWWAPRKKPLYIDFTERKIGAIVSRGNKLVPEIIREACKEAEIGTDDIGCLITNQPNRIFIRNWREALCLPEEKQVHTYPEHGNTFGAAIPVSLERAIDQGVIKPGSHIALGGFSHAGDYAASAVIQWQAN
jgi:3-oxoacyl-[acyl-carrier-protein] synthase-3